MQHYGGGPGGTRQRSVLLAALQRTRGGSAMLTPGNFNFNPAAHTGGGGSLSSDVPSAAALSTPGVTPSALRAEMLSFLCEPAPPRFPGVPSMFVNSGGLGA